MQPGVGFAAVDAPASAALRADTAAAAALSAHRVHAAGLRLVLTEVAVESSSAGRVMLRVTDERPAYELLDPRGTLLPSHRLGRRGRHRI